MNKCCWLCKYFNTLIRLCSNSILNVYVGEKWSCDEDYCSKFEPKEKPKKKLCKWLMKKWDKNIFFETNYYYENEKELKSNYATEIPFKRLDNAMIEVDDE